MKQCLAACLAALACTFAAAQPAASPPTSSPLVIMVGGPPGTPGDVVARTLSTPLGLELGQPVIVENRPGAAGTVALGAVARARPDGNTLGVLALQSAVAPALVKTVPYNTAADLLPIRQLTSVSNLLVVRTESPWTSLDDVLKAGREGTLTYASGGNGTPAHLAGELFGHEARVRLQHVPFNGAVAGVTAVLGGHVQMMFATAPAVAPLVQSGRLRALATTSPVRLPVAPMLRTLAESGMAAATVQDWHGLVAPAGTPPERVAQIDAATAKVLASDAVRQRLAAAGLDVVNASGPKEFANWLRSEMERWGVVVRRAGITLQ